MAQNKTSRGPRNKTKRAWMQEHVTDQYVKRASLEGYRSRAVYKLQEILARDKLVKPGMCVVDLGAAPGGWSQLIAPQVRPGGTVFALDLLEMAPVADVHFIQGDFREETVLQQLNKALNGRPVDLVLSDMAPNISGIASMDQARSAHLVELALEFAGSRLKPGGALLVKVFQGECVAEIRSQMNSQFESVVVRKPAASRDRSKEFFLLARGAKSPGSVGSVA